MRVDLYTKFVLTVIAVSLLWLCVDTLVHPRTTALAQGGSQRVVIVGIEDPRVSDQKWSPISVEIMQQK